VLSAGCCQSQPTATTPAKSNQAKYRKNSHTLSARPAIESEVSLDGLDALMGEIADSPGW
jgi:hypothetical protein